MAKRGKVVASVEQASELNIEVPGASPGDIGKVVDVYEPGEEPIVLAGVVDARCQIVGITVGEVYERHSPEFIKAWIIRVVPADGRPEDVPVVRKRDLDAAHAQYAKDMALLRVTIDKLRGLLTDAIERITGEER